MASAPAYPYKRYSDKHDSIIMRGHARLMNPLNERLRFDAVGHFYYDSPGYVDLKARKKLVEQAEYEYNKKRADVRNKLQQNQKPSTPYSSPKPSSASTISQPEHNLSILEARQKRLSKYIDGYNSELQVPHVYNAYGPCSSMSVTAFGPQRYDKGKTRAFRTTSQEAFAWRGSDVDNFADRAAFTKKGEFTEYTRASLMKQVDLKKTAH